MRNKLFLLLLAFAIIIPAYSQDKDKKAKPDAKAATEAETREKETKKDSKEKELKSDSLENKVYSEMVLEDFEETQYSTKSNLDFSITKDQQAECKIREEYPAPTVKSKKYLGVKFYATRNDVLTIKPAKELIITKHSKEISAWVYGKGFSGELSLMLQDAQGKNHRKVLGTLNFYGWRKLKVQLSQEVAQEDKYLNKKLIMKILFLQYRPANEASRPIWHYFYLDDIAAQVREKYADVQNDDW